MLINGKRLVAALLTGHVAMAFADVCKTPPIGIPVPYPNVSPSVLLGIGCPTKTFVMGGPMWTRPAKTTMSMGDNAGVMGGVMSQIVMGPCSPVMTSFDTYAEGGGVVRTMDMIDANGLVGAMGNKGIGTVISTVAFTVSGMTKTPACNAFATAVDEYCTDDVAQKKGTFNDYFFKTLTKTKPEGTALAETIKGVDGTKAADPVAALVALGPRGSAARRLLLTNAGTNGSGAAASPSGQMWSAAAAKWLKADLPKSTAPFPHGTLHNVPVVVKGPGDTFRPGEMEELQRVAMEDKVFEVSCECCGEPCAQGNKCK